VSKRHRDEKPLRNPKEVRRLQQRAVRHRTDQALHASSDVDAVVFDEVRSERRGMRSRVGGQVRHWKLKSWKRRSALNAQRNAALSQLLAGE
jgi:hypothetical protein